MHLPQLQFRSHLTDLIAERDDALAQVEQLERENDALRLIALASIMDGRFLLPGETREERLAYLIEQARRDE